MRVVAGELGSRRLVGPPPGVRPTADRVRESLFARLGDPAGMRVLDLYAGTGALAIECLSRGADEAVLVDRAPSSLAVIRENLAALDLDSKTRVLRGDSVKVVHRLGRSGERFGLVFIDPPYASMEAHRALQAVVEAGVLAPDGSVVVETAKRHPLRATPGLRVLAEWGYGDTLLVHLARGDSNAQAGRARSANLEKTGVG